jgi:hypothetical protein
VAMTTLRSGFWPVRAAPRVYVLHQRKGSRYGQMLFGGAAGDYGFEASPLD